MSILPKQLSIGELVMGEGTPYIVRSGTDMFRSSARSTGGGEKAWADGTWAGAEFADERTLAIQLTITGTGTNPTEVKADTMAKWWELKRACRAIGFGPEVEVRFYYDQEYLVRGRPRLVEPNMDYVERGFIHCSVGVTCPNPRIFAAEPETLTGITLPVSVGGTTWPIQFPVQFTGSQVGGSGTITNYGTDTTGFQFRINGPVERPTINVDNELGPYRMTVALNLSDGEYVDIDTSARTATLNGSSSVRGQLILEPSGVFPVADVGPNVIEFRGSSTDMSATLDVTLYSAYN